MKNLAGRLTVVLISVFIAYLEFSCLLDSMYRGIQA